MSVTDYDDPAEADIEDPVATRMKAMCEAARLCNLGYIGISNKYMRIARIDRKDWLEVIAANQKCSIAELYTYGTGVPSLNWVYDYIRNYTRDTIEIKDRAVYSAMAKNFTDNGSKFYVPK